MNFWQSQLLLILQLLHTNQIISLPSAGVGATNEVSGVTNLAIRVKDFQNDKGGDWLSRVIWHCTRMI